jgi:uncharacterized lipoprotein
VRRFSESFFTVSLADASDADANEPFFALDAKKKKKKKAKTFHRRVTKASDGFVAPVDRR